MAIFVLDDATGIGSNDLNAAGAFVDLTIIANDDGLGLDDPVGGQQLVTYARTLGGVPQVRLDTLVNTAFTPDYGGGPQNVDTFVIAGLSGFTLDDGTSMANNGTALPPASSGLAGASLNPTENCLVIYDTQQTICVARAGTGGDIDLPISNPVVLYHEFSHAFRILNNSLLALTAQCNPSSPEENAAIVDENDLRTDIANRQGVAPELRDPGIHCGRVHSDCSACCIIATVVSRSLSSPQVQYLRCVRDRFVRSTEVGYAFFEQFFHDYYAFSPQVCTLLARQPGLTTQLLEGYVNPLLDFWRLMIERTDADTGSLGQAFIQLHPDPRAAQERLTALRTTAIYWLRQDSEPDSAVPAALLTLLKDHAWSSPHIQWALVAPVRIYHDLLSQYLAGANAPALEHALNAALEGWAPEVPLSPLWGSLSAHEIVRELRFCSESLLKTPTNKKRFLARLQDRFSDITAIKAVALDELNGLEGAL